MLPKSLMITGTRKSVALGPILLQDVDDAQHGLVYRRWEAMTFAQLHHLSGKNLHLGFPACLNVLQHGSLAFG
jgi:hypothetical protein